MSTGRLAASARQPSPPTSAQEKLEHPEVPMVRRTAQSETHRTRWLGGFEDRIWVEISEGGLIWGFG